MNLEKRLQLEGDMDAFINSRLDEFAESLGIEDVDFDHFVVNVLDVFEKRDNYRVAIWEMYLNRQKYAQGVDGVVRKEGENLMLYPVKKENVETFKTSKSDMMLQWAENSGLDIVT